MWVGWVARRHRFDNGLEIQRIRGIFGEETATDIHTGLFSLGLSSVGIRPGYCLVFFWWIWHPDWWPASQNAGLGVGKKKNRTLLWLSFSSIFLSKFHFFQNTRMWAWDFGGPSWRPVGTSMLLWNALTGMFTTQGTSYPDSRVTTFLTLFSA